jgi:hypothetical protein
VYGILVSAFNFILGFLVRSVVVKFVIAFALYFGVLLMTQVLVPMLPQVTAIQAALSGIPSGVWWFLDVFNFGAGLPLIVSAYMTRFVIRRIPLIG